MPRAARIGIAGGFAALLVAAAALRLVGIGFGLPYPYANVDEHIVTDRALLMTTGDWNPHYFAYPSLCFGLHALVAFALYAFGRIVGEWGSLEGFRAACWLDPAPLLLASRLVTALIAIASVWAVARLAAELARAAWPDPSPESRRASRRARWVGGAALALSFLHVGNSRVVTVDVPVVFCAALSLAHALRHLRKGATRDALLAALLGGLAASSKYYGAWLALPVATAVVLRALRGGEGARSAAARSARGLLACAAAMIAAFLATSPYVVLDWATFRHEFALLGAHMEGGHYGHDATRNGALVYARLLAGRNAGAWLLAPAALGVVAGLWKARGAMLLLLAQPVAHFALIATFKSQPADYLLPLLPALCACAGLGVAVIARACDARLGGARAGTLATALLAAPLLIGGGLALQQGLALRATDTRVQLRAWAEANLPSGTRIAADTWLELPLTASCLELMLEGRVNEDPQPLRRGRDEPLVQLEAKLADARAREPRPAYDFALLTPREIDLGDELLSLLEQNDFRWLVLDGAHAARAERSGAAFSRRAAFTRGLMASQAVVERFDPGPGGANGPPLVVIDLTKPR